MFLRKIKVLEKSRVLQFRVRSGLSKEEVEKMAKEAEAHAEEDKKSVKSYRCT
jgi:molecular chaperone DnaK (HSP70)